MRNFARRGPRHSMVPCSMASDSKGLWLIANNWLQAYKERGSRRVTQFQMGYIWTPLFEPTLPKEIIKNFVAETHFRMHVAAHRRRMQGGMATESPRGDKGLQEAKIHLFGRNESRSAKAYGLGKLLAGFQGFFGQSSCPIDCKTHGVLAISAPLQHGPGLTEGREGAARENFTLDDLIEATGRRGRSE